MVKLGLIADVQYADSDDAWDFHHTHLRRYRASLGYLRSAIAKWKEDQVDLIVSLGDLIDGRNRELAGESTRAATAVMTEFEELKQTPLIQLIGNHDLYNFTRVQLVAGIDLNISRPLKYSNDQGATYYEVSLSSKWSAIILDAFAHSMLSVGGGRIGKDLDSIDEQARTLCQSNNPNSLTAYQVDFFADLPAGPAQRWVPLNGGLGEIQRNWLQSTLEILKVSGKSAVVFCHAVIHPEATPGGNCQTLLWDYHETLEILSSSGVVKLTISGHAHQERYCLDGQTHHLTLPSPLETIHPTDCSATLILDDDGKCELMARGFPSRVFD